MTGAGIVDEDRWPYVNGLAEEMYKAMAFPPLDVDVIDALSDQLDALSEAELCETLCEYVSRTRQELAEDPDGPGEDDALIFWALMEFRFPSEVQAPRN
jgi:hypothetical protein